MTTAQCAIAVVCLLVLTLYGCQRSLMYHPSRYEPAQLVADLTRVVRLEFDLGKGPQFAYYLPPAGQSPAGALAPPPRLWVMFDGNAGRALNWLGFFDSAGMPDPEAGWLLVEYPGYGGSAGKPKLAEIRETSFAALDALAKHFGAPRAALEKDLRVAGFSMGCATGLEFAAREPVRRLVLIAPYTSMLDMARHRYGLLGEIVVDRYDNRARLTEIMARPEPPQLFILHGDDDEVVPVEQGRELARMFPQARYFETPGANHRLLEMGEDRIAACLAPDAP